MFREWKVIFSCSEAKTTRYSNADSPIAAYHQRMESTFLHLSESILVKRESQRGQSVNLLSRSGILLLEEMGAAGKTSTMPHVTLMGNMEDVALNMGEIRYTLRSCVLVFFLYV